MFKVYSNSASTTKQTRYNEQISACEPHTDLTTIIPELFHTDLNKEFLMFFFKHHNRRSGHFFCSDETLATIGFTRLRANNQLKKILTLANPKSELGLGVSLPTTHTIWFDQKYVTVPSDLLDLGLTPKEFKFHVWLSEHGGKTELTLRAIAKQLGVHTNSISRWVNKLRSVGMLVVHCGVRVSTCLTRVRHNKVFSGLTATWTKRKEYVPKRKRIRTNKFDRGQFTPEEQTLRDKASTYISRTIEYHKNEPTRYWRELPADDLQHEIEDVLRSREGTIEAIGHALSIMYAPTVDCFRKCFESSKTRYPWPNESPTYDNYIQLLDDRLAGLDVNLPRQDDAMEEWLAEAGAGYDV